MSAIDLSLSLCVCSGSFMAMVPGNNIWVGVSKASRCMYTFFELCSETSEYVSSFVSDIVEGRDGAGRK